MTRREIIEGFTGAAMEIYPEPEARAIAFLITERFYGFGRKEAAVSPGEQVGNFGREQFERIVAELLSWRPVQYITGMTEFAGVQIEVAEGVLIPRPETEELVVAIVRSVRESRAEVDPYGKSMPDSVPDIEPIRDSTPESEPMPNSAYAPCAVNVPPATVASTANRQLGILDIGTGSGAIAVALAAALSADRVDALDISEEALGIARRNAALNGVVVNFFQADILGPLEELPEGVVSRKYDVIVSNPPYIPESEKIAIRENVKGHEPSLALFVPDGDPLLFYRAIGKKALSMLSPAGELWFEVHENFARAVCASMRQMGFGEVELLYDINGKERMVRCRLN